MADLTLKLQVDSYDQPSKDEDGDPTPRTRGEVFDANDKREYDRLIEIGAANDPAKAVEQERAEIEERLRALEAQRADLNDRITREQSAAVDPSDLKGKELDAALESRGLSTDGSADEKRARLSESVAAEQA